MSGYFKQQVSEDIFKTKYCLHDGDTDWDKVSFHIAEEVAMAEKHKNRTKWQDIFYQEIVSGRFIPGGRILANARIYSPMKNYSNCFTIGIDDDMESIFNSLTEDALISKAGGGVGFNVSKIRPKGSPLSTGGTSSGPMSFLEIFNTSASTIKTGGGRRSAHICIMDVSHPDIEEFITYKQGDGNKRLTNFNISVGITDAFMEAVELDKDWNLVYGGKVYKTIKAKDLYNLMTSHAYTHNEPGVYFIDTANKFNNGWWAFDLNQVNPCGEITMPEYSLCDLGSINLTQFVINPFTKSAHFDYHAFSETCKIGVRFLDNVLDRTTYPLPKIEKISKQWRRIGLGITGLADTMVMLNYTYGKQDSLIFAEDVSQTLERSSYMASVDLAREKGKFPACDKAQLAKSRFVRRMDANMQYKIRKYGLRNIGLNTVAPTGTTSLSIGNNCSSGIEPIFSLEYNRTIRNSDNEGTRQEKVMDYAWLLYNQLKNDDVDVVGNPPFVTTKDVDGVDAIKVQAMMQKNIDHSISKTHSLKPGTTLEEYQELFRYAWLRALKGFTTFNPDGSMKGILEYSDQPKKVVGNHAEKRPKTLPCDIYYTSVGKENFLVLIGKREDGTPYEIFVTTMEGRSFDTAKMSTGGIDKVKKGCYNLIINDTIIIEDISKEFDSTLGTLSRFISMSLRHNVPLQFIVEQLHKGNGFASFEKVVGRILKKYIPAQEKVLTSVTCPECGADLMYVEGCKKCSKLCGWELCS